MKIFIMIAGVLALASPNNQFIKPVNSSPEAIKKEKTINVVTSIEIENFIPVVSAAITYEELKYFALYDCKNNKQPSLKLIELLISIEKSYNPPPKMRGMILAAACMESGFRSTARGDRKFSRDKKTPMALGILQLWPIYEKMYPGLDRTNASQAATAWMKHIVKKIPKVKRQCKYKKPGKVWLAAWVTGIRYKKPEGRCNERPKHYRLLKRWHRKIQKERRQRVICAEQDVCGC